MILETDRLVLRPLEEGDANALFALFGDSIAMKWFPSARTLEETRAWTKAHASLFAITLAETVIGYCGVQTLMINDQQETELLYGLNRQYWGQGYATEAAIAVRGYALTNLKVSRLVSIVRPENTASRAVVQRLGMQRQGTCRHKGYDHEVWVT